jgi:kynureninase
VDEELNAWADLGIGGHFREQAPWFTYAELLAEATARVVGALPVEVVTMNALTVNLHLLLATFYRPTNERHRVLMEAGAFPSDRYAMASHLRGRGIDPSEAITLVEPRPGEAALRTEDIEARIAEEGSRLALVWLPGVQYLTGQWLDIERITAAGHEAGCVVGWDLAHAAGNVPLRLHDWGVDFAVWCTYKYMNAGPGSIGQAFVHERWARDGAVSRYAGWWGNDPETRFAFSAEFEPRDGAAGWQISNPPILALAPLRASMAIFDEVGMDALRARSERMTAYLESSLEALGIGEQITPRDAAARGAQLSLRVGHRAQQVEQELARRGAVIDFREPDVIRFAPAPLYSTFHEAWRFAHLLAEVLG